MTLFDDSTKFFCTFSIQFFHIVKYNERVLYVAAKILHSVYVSVAAEWCTVCLDIVLVACAVVLACAFAHHSVSDDEGRALLFLQGCIEGAAYLVGIVAVDFQNVPSP